MNATADYRPVFQRGNFQSSFEPRYASRYMGQAPAPAPSTTPAPAAAPKKTNVPLVLGISAGSGALVGYLATLIYQKADKRFPKGTAIRGYGTLGGLIGALVGAGTVLLLKD